MGFYPMGEAIFRLDCFPCSTLTFPSIYCTRPVGCLLDSSNPSHHHEGNYPFPSPASLPLVAWMALPSTQLPKTEAKHCLASFLLPVPSIHVPNAFETHLHLSITTVSISSSFTLNTASVSKLILWCCLALILSPYCNKLNSLNATRATHPNTIFLRLLLALSIKLSL